MSSSSRSGGLNRLLMSSGGQIQTTTVPISGNPWILSCLIQWKQIPLTINAIFRTSFKNNTAEFWKKKQTKKLQTAVFSIKIQWILAKLPRVIGQGARLLSPGAEALYLSWKCRGDVTCTSYMWRDMSWYVSFKTYLIYIIYHKQCIYTLCIIILIIIYSRHATHSMRKIRKRLDYIDD